MEIKQIVENYFELKDEQKDLESRLKPLRAQIEEYMSSVDSDVANIGDYNVSYKASERCTLNEEKLLQRIKELADKEEDPDAKQTLLSCIKLVEKVDQEFIEELIYDDVLDSKLLEDCTEVKEYWTLIVSKKRRK